MEASFLWNIIFCKSLQEMKTLHNNDGQEIVTMLSRDGGGGKETYFHPVGVGGGKVKKV